MQPSHGHDMTIVNGISRIGYMTGGKSRALGRRGHGRRVHRQGRRASSSATQAAAVLPLLRHARHPRAARAAPALRRHERRWGRAATRSRNSTGPSAKCSNALDRLKLADNTLVIFTSDNGPVVDDGYRDEAVEKLGDHKPAGPLRGGKYSTFEGGTRVPFIVRWPGEMKPGVERRARLPDRFARVARLADRPAAARRPRRPTASTCCPRCSANQRKAARTLWNMPTR